MGAEGAIAIAAGVLSGSIALVAFGIDSAIEGVASLVTVWRFTGSRLLSPVAEGRAQRLVAVQFFLLHPTSPRRRSTSWSSGSRRRRAGSGCARHHEPRRDLGTAKRRLADTLGSVAERGEGTQNLLCAYHAAAVLAGLFGNALFGLWWLDPFAALVVAAVAVREGIQSWRGEGCRDGC